MKKKFIIFQKAFFKKILFTFILLQSINAFAYRFPYYEIFCFEKLIPWKEWIPVGCEVIDCCPGCPGPPIDWRIRYESQPGIKLILTFENLSQPVKEKLKIEGNGKWISATELEVSSGRLALNGFPSGTKDIILVNPRFVIDDAHFQKTMDMDKDSLGGNQYGKDEISQVNFTIEQFKGKYLVNDAKYIIILKKCWFPQPPQFTDRVRAANNLGGDNTVILLDGRRNSGCVDDEQWRTTNTANVGSVLSNGACNAETIVFSNDNAMAILTPSTQWTDPLGNLQTVNLNGLIQVPVTIWVLVPNDLARVQADVNRANQLFNEQHTGIVLNVTINDVSNDPNVGNFMSTTFGCTLAERNNLTGSAFFTAGRLNVYYVNGSANGNRGFNCTGNRNISVIGTNADNESMAHELGHAFSLGHTNGIAGIPNTNLMVTGGTGRNSITEGQDFRMNMNPTSMLNANGTRVGITRTCADGTTSVTCPSLALDVLPN